jgi:hypothetical protein
MAPKRHAQSTKIAQEAWSLLFDRNCQEEEYYAAFAIFPALIQLVQTFIRSTPPCGR